ncbi:hypothetical protein [Dinoroseobacter sp. S76]|uniref:hypothetical protein n=1 Tax=Dinoroseobacter sp. S76 TaxID=3415124 RepID=UPI003C7EBE86
MDEVNHHTLKAWSIGIVELSDPDDVFVVEEGFDAMAASWDKAASQDEGRFITGAEVAAFAAIVGPFLLAIFSGALKGAVEDQFKKVFGSLLGKVLKRDANANEVEKLRKLVAEAIDKSKYSAPQKSELRSGFERMFAQLASSDGKS